MTSSVGNSNQVVVWEYGEGGHVKLIIDNSPEDQKPRIALLKMEFNHLHSGEEGNLSNLSIEDLRNRMFIAGKCSKTMSNIASGYIKMDEGTVLSKEESKQIQYQALMQSEICEMSGKNYAVNLLRKLYPEVETESNPKLKKMIQLEIEQIEEMLEIEISTACDQ